MGYETDRVANFFREILDQSVNKTFGHTDLQTWQPYNNDYEDDDYEEDNYEEDDSGDDDYDNDDYDDFDNDVFDNDDSDDNDYDDDDYDDDFSHFIPFVPFKILIMILGFPEFQEIPLLGPTCQVHLV